MKYLIKENLALSFYQYDDIEKNFISFLIELCQKYPFRFHYLLKKVFSSSQATYLKDTTMIINLNFFPLDKQQYLFRFLRKLLQIEAATKVIDKKEFIIIHLYSHKIGEFFLYPTRWLGYLFYDVFQELYQYERCQLGVVNSNNDFYDLYLERLGIPFIIISQLGEEDQNQTIKKIYLFSTDARSDELSGRVETIDCIEYRYNKEKFKQSVKNYFDNPCNLTRFVV